MKKSICLLFGFLQIIFINSSFGQTYRTAVGARFIDGIGLSINQLLIPSNNVTLEGIYHLSKKDDYSQSLSLIAKKHHNIIIRNVNFYYGAGGRAIWNNDDSKKVNYGASLIGGFELSLGRINLSADFKPTFKISGEGNFVDPNFGISARYILFKRPKNNPVKKLGKKFDIKKRST